MVNALELKLRNSPNYIKIGISLIVIAIIGGLIYLVLTVLVFGNNDDKNQNSSFIVSKELASTIEDLEFNVSQPQQIPTDYSRVFVGVISENSSASGCEEVAQIFTGEDSILEISEDPNSLPEALESQESITEIDMYSYSLECGFEIPEDAESFSVGDYPGWISDSDPTKTTLIEIAVNQAYVRVETSLKREEILKVINKFEPFSPNPPPASVVL